MSKINKENLCKSMDELCMRIKITRDEIEERKLMVINTKEALENLFHDNNKGLLKQDTRRALQIEVNQKRRVYVSKYSSFVDIEMTNEQFKACSNDVLSKINR